MSLILDIETVPDDREIPQEFQEKYLPVLKVAKNLKDKAKISAAYVDWEKSFEKKKGLDPAFGRIVCIGMIHYDEPKKTIINEKTYTNKDEKKLLKEFWDYISINNIYFRTITFNGLEFDLPFMYTRTIYHGVHMTVTPELRKFSYHPHFDLMQALQYWKYGAFKSLAFWMWYFGITDLKKGDSSKIKEYWDAGDIAKITEHCMVDCHGVLRLYQKVKAYFPSK